MIVWQKGDRVISIDEYIEYLDECANIVKGSEEGDRLSRQHTQLAEWLRELKSMRRLYNDLADVCEELYVDNVRYKSCLTDDGENARMILGEMSELKTENAKLRELMRDIYVQYDGILDWVEIERRMSELGIEVPHERE